MNVSYFWVRKILMVYFSLIFFATAYIGVVHYIDNDSWVIGDWLINYEGGFIRRGFLGQIALLFESPKTFVFCLQLFFYMFILASSYVLIVNTGVLKKYSLIICSPAIFLFQIYDYQGGFRKEIIAFSLILLHILSRQYGSIRMQKMLYFLALFAYPLLILSHEILAIFLPLIIIVNESYFKKYPTISIPLLLISIVTFLFTVSVGVTQEKLEAICRALIDFCDSDINKNGAISWLIYDSKFAFTQVQEHILSQNTVYLYFFALLLSLVGLVPIRKDLVYLYKSRLRLGLFFLFLLGLVSITFIAVDWGRLIYILIFSLFFLSFVDKQKVDNIDTPAAYSLSFSCKYLVCVALYCFAWRLPHYYGISFLPLWLELALFEF